MTELTTLALACLALLLLLRSKPAPSVKKHGLGRGLFGCSHSTTISTTHETENRKSGLGGLYYGPEGQHLTPWDDRQLAPHVRHACIGPPGCPPVNQALAEARK